jgi:hypothetical protein
VHARRHDQADKTQTPKGKEEKETTRNEIKIKEIDITHEYQGSPGPFASSILIPCFRCALILALFDNNALPYPY